MRPSNLAHRMGLALFDERNGSVDARRVGLDGSCFDRLLAFDGPRFELMREGGWMRTEHHTNAKTNGSARTSSAIATVSAYAALMTGLVR